MVKSQESVSLGQRWSSFSNITVYQTTDLHLGFLPPFIHVILFHVALKLLPDVKEEQRESIWIHPGTQQLATQQPFS